MPSLSAYIIASLATYYAALVVATQAGPKNIFADLRQLLLSAHLDGHGKWCTVCASAWTAAPIAVLMGVLGLYDIWLWPVVWLGLAGGSVLIDKVWKR